MRKIITTLCLGASFLVSFAQEGEKIKGNKDVVEKRISIPESYHTLDVDGDFEIALRKQASLSANIEIDSNLLPLVDMAVTNGVLTITTTQPISRSKEMKVTLGYNDELATIIVKDKVKLEGGQAINVEKFLVEAGGSSSVSLSSNAPTTEILLSDKAKYEGTITSKDFNADQSGTSKIKAIITSADSVSSTLHEKSDITLSGESKKSVFALDGDVFLNAIKLNSVAVDMTSAKEADAYFKCLDKVVLQLSGKSDTYIMGNPLIELKGFEDEASLHKTKKAPGSLKKLIN